MTYLGGGKPSLDDLAHYGVLGMKWGNRAKANGSDIRSARRRLTKQVDTIDTQKSVVNKTGKGQAKLASMKVDFLNNPDRVIANRLTRGEKAFVMLMAGPTAGVTVAAIAGTSAVSRRIEQKQATGAYNKKK